MCISPPSHSRSTIIEKDEKWREFNPVNFESVFIGGKLKHCIYRAEKECTNYAWHYFRIVPRVYIDRRSYRLIHIKYDQEFHKRKSGVRKDLYDWAYSETNSSTVHTLRYSASILRYLGIEAFDSSLGLVNEKRRRCSEGRHAWAPTYETPCVSGQKMLTSSILVGIFSSVFFSLSLSIFFYSSGLTHSNYMMKQRRKSRSE